MKRSIAVIGLGYVGLPLALAFTQKGFQVTGIDVDQNKLNCLKQGKSYLPDIPDETILAAIEQQGLSVADNYTNLHTVSAVIICVPTPLNEDREPDLRFLQQVGQSLSKFIKKGQLIVLESSTFPGTTTDVLLPLLEQSGLRVGKDIFLAYSPERIDPGNLQYPLETIPKIVSGVTPICKQRLIDLYNTVFAKLVPVSSTKAAELSKLLENSYRFINISFINELTMLCDSMNIDIWEVIDASGTKPYGFSEFYPSAGIGGHCIPVDPLYLQWRAKAYGLSSKLIESSQQINMTMPYYAIDQIKSCLPEPTLMNRHIFVVGVSYKRDIGDIRESSAIEMMSIMMNEGAKLAYHDPFVPNIEVNGIKMSSQELRISNLSNVDCVVLAVNHTDLPLQHILEHTALVYDTRNMTKDINGKAHVVRLGAGRDKEEKRDHK